MLNNKHNDITPLIDTISEIDQSNLENMMECNDYHTFVERDEIESFFDRLKLLFWYPINKRPDNVDEQRCSFCKTVATYHNDSAEMLACDACMYDIENKEIDIINPDEHPVSLKLRTIVCNWIDKNYYMSTSTDSYFDEYGIKYNKCFICCDVIANEPKTDISIAIGADAIAHYSCIEREGFKDYFTTESYNDIISSIHLDDCIGELDETPYYTPPIPVSESERLNKIVENNLQLNLTVIRSTFFSYLRNEYWNPIKRSEGCTFCQYQCNFYNADLNILSCSKCMDILVRGNINIIDPVSCVDMYLRFVIHKWMDKNYYYRMSANSLFNEVNITYDVCHICKLKIIPDEDIGVIKDAIAHVTCIEDKGLSFVFRYQLMNDILKSKTAELTDMIQSIK
jgi:hypothetical protein